MRTPGNETIERKRTVPVRLTAIVLAQSSSLAIFPSCVAIPAQFTMPSKRPGMELMNLWQSSRLEISVPPKNLTVLCSVELGKSAGTLST